jgi:hypothetical protein
MRAQFAGFSAIASGERSGTRSTALSANASVLWCRAAAAPSALDVATPEAPLNSKCVSELRWRRLLLCD